MERNPREENFFYFSVTVRPLRGYTVRKEVRPVEDMEQIYQQHAQTVYKFLMAQTGNAHLAEELTQETFYQAVRSIHRFDGSCKVSVWLCQIAKHLWYQHLRRQKHEVPADEETFQVPLPSAEEELFRTQDQISLLRQVHDLPDPGREVVYLRAFGGLSFREIGDIMGRTENWARVTFYRSKEKLKGGLSREE